MGLTKLHRFDYVQLRDVFATNPMTGALTPYLQGFAVTDDVEGAFIPRKALHPFLNPIEEPIPMSRIVMVNCLPIERYLELDSEECAFCGHLLKASDTYCCPECGWKLNPKGSQ